MNGFARVQSNTALKAPNTLTRFAKKKDSSDPLQLYHFNSFKMLLHDGLS